MSPDQIADYEREEQDFDYRLIHKRHALRTSTCDVCHEHVEGFEMWQEPMPGAEDGLLYGHRACVQPDGHNVRTCDCAECQRFRYEQAGDGEQSDGEVRG